MQRINGTPFMRQKCIPLPNRQHQVNVNNNFVPRVTRGPWCSYIAHLKNIAFGQDCSAQLKFMTMTEVYVVLVLWNIIL